MNGAFLMKQLRTSVLLVALLASSAIAATADPVLDWNEKAVKLLIGQAQSPFAQARYMAITQLAVFEAVNAITHDYEPYLGTVGAPAGARTDAAAISAAYHVLKYYFSAAPGLDTDYATALAAIPPSQAKDDGIATGDAAATAMILNRVNDGSAPPTTFSPPSTDPGVWQKTGVCTAGINFQWQNITPFGVPSNGPGDTDWIAAFEPGPPPHLTSGLYARDFNEVKRVGDKNAGLSDRPQDRADVATFYAASSPALVFNSAARQVATALGRSLSENARTLALLNMASSDALVASFFTKYKYQLWRPVTAIAEAEFDGNHKTNPPDAPAPAFVPFIVTPCFPSWPSNHASGSNSAAEILRREFGQKGHHISMVNAAVSGIAFEYTAFDQITADIDDARVYGGIHYRFDQVVGGQLGRQVATFVYQNNLRPVHP
jgi:hypothetical protein